MIDVPIIYCNGDSYSDENFHETLQNNMYPNFVAKFCHGYVINKAKNGSCNRRIVRTTVHDSIHQRQLNPDKKIIALIGLSFELRSEIWADKVTHREYAEESNFIRHHFTKQMNWRENLLHHRDIEPEVFSDNFDEEFFKKYSDGRAYFYSPYAERINLLCDLIMLRSLLESLNIHFLIFSSPPVEILQTDYLLDFFKTQLENDQRFFPLEQFSFVNWCYTQKFTPIDYPDRPEIAHYGPDAQQAFAQNVLLPKLKEINAL